MHAATQTHVSNVSTVEYHTTLVRDGREEREEGTGITSCVDQLQVWRDRQPPVLKLGRRSTARGKDGATHLGLISQSGVLKGREVPPLPQITTSHFLPTLRLYSPVPFCLRPAIRHSPGDPLTSLCQSILLRRRLLHPQPRKKGLTVQSEQSASAQRPVVETPDTRSLCVPFLAALAIHSNSTNLIWIPATTPNPRQSIALIGGDIISLVQPIPKLQEQDLKEKHLYIRINAFPSC